MPALTPYNNSVDLQDGRFRGDLRVDGTIYSASVPVMAAVYGFVGDGVSSNSEAWVRLAADTTSPTVRFPKGIYLIGDGLSTYNMASDISLVGDGASDTVLQIPDGVTRAGGSNLFSWTARNNVSVRDLTIDLNDMVVTGSGSELFAPIVFRGGDNVLVDHISIINGAKRMNLIAVVGQSEITKYTITNCYLHITTPSTEYNQAILVSAPLTFDVSGGLIQGNTCVNSGMAIAGSASAVIGNDVYGWAFGSGIYAPVGDLHHHLQIIGNAFHDGAASPGLDENNTPTHGIEVHSAYPIIAHNNIWNNGGSGIASFAKHAKIDNNWIYGNGHRVDTTTGYGIFAAYQNEDNNGNYTSISGNYVRDDGSGDQVYAYFEMTHDSLGGPYNYVCGNDFQGSTAGAKISLNTDSKTQTSPQNLLQHRLVGMTEAGSFSFPTPQIGGHFHAILSGAGTITDYSVVLPACNGNSDALKVSIGMVSGVTNLAVTAAAGSVNYAPPTLGAGQSFCWVCRGSSTTWFIGA